MGTLKDELKQSRVEEMVHRAVNTSDTTVSIVPQEDEHVGTSDNGEYLESIEEALARILQTCDSMGQSVDDDLEAAIAHRERGREQLVLLFVKQDQLQAMVGEIEQKLARAESYRLNDFVISYTKSLTDAREAIVLCQRGIGKMGGEYPEVVGEIKEEREVHRVANQMLVLLAQDNEERYTAEGTPQPVSAEAREWFEARMEEAIAAKVVCAQIAEEKALLQSATGSWTPRLASAQAVDAYAALLGYQRAIQKVERTKSREWVNGLIASSFLIPPDEVERQKRNYRSGAQRTILDLLEQQSGYCFIRVYTNKKTRIEPYASLYYPEAKIEYAVNGYIGTAKHAIRITAVTAPQLVEDFFKKGVQTFTFDDPYELAERTSVALVVRTALDRALRYGRQRRKSDEEINVIRIADALEFADLADGRSGTAVVFIPGQVCMQLVSDGTMVVMGKMTERSKQHWLYEAVGQGVPVKTFLARNAMEEFASPELQKMAVENEVSEISQRVSLAHAERILAASNNVTHLVMPVDQGGRDGTYVFSAVLYGRTERGGIKVEPDRRVGYVVGRTGDSVEFLEALSQFSRRKIETSGLELQKPYALVGGLNDYGLLLFRSLYCAVTRTPREKAPEHLREGFRSVE